uniref:Uncharacterized protein n=1 Tax=Heterorhabditis bacteriophora TaxID=37862 RepID=A0A1I7X7H0_HETBA
MAQRSQVMSIREKQEKAIRRIQQMQNITNITIAADDTPTSSMSTLTTNSQDVLTNLTTKLGKRKQKHNLRRPAKRLKDEGGKGRKWPRIPKGGVRIQLEVRQEDVRLLLKNKAKDNSSVPNNIHQ